MDSKLEKLSRPIVSLATALAALVGSCAALYKAVDKTMERKSYETTVRAIEDLRRDNEEMRRVLSPSASAAPSSSAIFGDGFEAIDSVDISLHKISLGVEDSAPSAGVDPTAAAACSIPSIPTPLIAVPIASASSAPSAAYGTPIKPKLVKPPTSAPTMTMSSAAAARPRPPLPAWSDL